MSDDQNRGRRRPSREYHTSSSHSPLDPSRATRRPLEHDRSSVEEPLTKVQRYDSNDPRRSQGVETHRSREPSEAPSTSSAAGKREREAGGDAPPARVEKSGEGNRRQRDNFELVHTRPADVKTKKGSQGRVVKLQANFFRLLTTPTWRIYQYHVDFDPAVELRRVRGGILSTHRALFGGYLYDGMKLFSTTKLEEDLMVLPTTSKSGEQYNITLKFVGVIAMSQWQSLQVLNLILRRAMEGLKLQLLGRNFFDPRAKIELREHRLQLWPGYQTSIRQHENDILLSAEIAHKVLRMETIYDIFAKCMQTSRDVKEDFKRNVLGLTVITDYNNKTYRVNDIDFTKNPNSTFQMKDKEISFADYYYQRYNLRIRDPKQPMLISKPKDRTIRSTGDDIVILIPELCRATGITDAMRSNFQLMRSMADQTRMNPDRRIERLRTFNRRLQETPASMQVLKDWNMKLDKQLVELDGRILEPQRIVFYDNKKESAGDQADWTRMFRDSALFTTPSRGLDRWSAIATNRNSRELRNFIESLMRAAGSMNLRISRPKEVLLYDDRNHTFLQAVEDCCRQDPQLIFCLVPNNSAERYALIKKKSCLERGVPTQVVTQRCAGNQRGLMSIATKVAIQINCKLGYTPWMIDMPLSGLMTIGYDIAKSTRDRSKAFGALVATMDMKVNATFYSTVAECSAYDVLATHLWPMMTKALRQYRKEQGRLPARILFYRDGVSEGSLKQLYEMEVKDIAQKLEEEYKRAEAEKPPMFAYVVVTKSMHTRFFQNGANPRPGTVVDDVITQPEHYDFYLVSQSVRQGTVSPTAYNVVYSKIGLTPDQMQLLTYKMTHLYYNWSGTTRVPAVCQYAKKLATLVATNLFQSPLNTLEKKLYYL